MRHPGLDIAFHSPRTPYVSGSCPPPPPTHGIDCFQVGPGSFWVLRLAAAVPGASTGICKIYIVNRPNDRRNKLLVRVLVPGSYVMNFQMLKDALLTMLCLVMD